MIDDELMQVFNKIENNKFQMLRGIWSRVPASHSKDSEVLIFPLQQLYTNLLASLTSPSSSYPKHLHGRVPDKPTT